MNETAEPSLTGVESIDDFVDTFSEDNASVRGAEERLLPGGESSTFYTMLLFHRGFCEYMFNDNFGFLLRNDPFFGPNTFGQCARFMPERTYVMQKQLNELKDEGWKTKAEFEPFVKALAGVPEHTNHAANRDFFLELPDKFFKIYERSLSDHILKRWRNDKLLPYMIGGQPELAKQLACKVVHHKQNMCTMDEAGEFVNHDDLPSYEYPNIDVELDDQHNTLKDEKLTINVRECMEYVTKNANFDTVVKDMIFLNQNENLIENLAASDCTVRLFDKLADGEFILWLVF